MLLLILALAVCYDYRDYRIPNWLILAGYGTSFFYRAVMQGKEGILLWSIGCACPVAVLYLLFYFKFLGAGDIKLFSVIGGFAGMVQVISVMVVSVFFGGLLSLIFLFQIKILKYRMQYLAEYFSKVNAAKRMLPYDREIQKGEQVSEKEYKKRGYIHYSAAILCAAVWCHFWL